MQFLLTQMMTKFSTTYTYVLDQILVKYLFRWHKDTRNNRAYIAIMFPQISYHDYHLWYMYTIHSKM